MKGRTQSSRNGRKRPRGSRRKRAKSYRYTILIHPGDPDETGYWVEVPALPGCFTQGETIEQCIERAAEAIEGHLQTLVELGEPIPEEPKQEDAVISRVQVAVPVGA